MRIMEMTAKQRLKAFAECNAHSVREFEREAGLTEGYINSIRKAPSYDMLSRVAERYPHLDMGYILTGVRSLPEQSAETPSDGVVIKSDIWEELKKMTETINSQQQTISVQAESIRHQTDSIYLLLKDADIEGLSIQKNGKKD